MLRAQAARYYNSSHALSPQARPPLVLVLDVPKVMKETLASDGGSRSRPQWSLNAMLLIIAWIGVCLAAIRWDRIVGLILVQLTLSLAANLACRWVSKSWLWAAGVSSLAGVVSGVAGGGLLGCVAVYEPPQPGVDNIIYFPAPTPGVFWWPPVIFCAEVGAVIGLICGCLIAFVAPPAWTVIDWLTMPTYVGGVRRWQFPAALLAAFVTMTIFCILIALQRS